MHRIDRRGYTPFEMWERHASRNSLLLELRELAGDQFSGEPGGNAWLFRLIR